MVQFGVCCLQIVITWLQALIQALAALTCMHYPGRQCVEASPVSCVLAGMRLGSHQTSALGGRTRTDQAGRWPCSDPCTSRSLCTSSISSSVKQLSSAFICMMIDHCVIVERHTQHCRQDDAEQARWRHLEIHPAHMTSHCARLLLLLLLGLLLPVCLSVDYTLTSAVVHRPSPVSSVERSGGVTDVPLIHRRPLEPRSPPRLAWPTFCRLSTALDNCRLTPRRGVASWPSGSRFVSMLRSLLVHHAN